MKYFINEDKSIRLYNGDCLEVMDKLIEEGIKVDCIITDPPYKVITGGNCNSKNTKRPKGILEENRDLMKSIPKFKDWLIKCFKIAKDNSQHYFMTNSTNLQKMLNTVTDAGFKVHNILVWEKNNCTPSQYYMKNCEYIIFARKGGAKYINNIGSSKTVHKFNNILGNKVHPTQKPVPLMEFYVSNSSNEGEIVFDMFMGSGSTGVACKNLNRKFIGIELDEKYFNIAKKRIIEEVE